MNKSEQLLLEVLIPKGEWIIDGKPWGGLQGWRCSLCNSKYDIHKLYTLMPYNFCPNCGAKMQKGGAE